jgi:hypothetical protein
MFDLLFEVWRELAVSLLTTVPIGRESCKRRIAGKTRFVSQSCSARRRYTGLQKSGTAGATPAN